MKAVAAISLVLIYMTSFVQPFFPYMEYVLNKDFIANELCENKDVVEMNCEGKCYLGQQLVEAVTQSDQTEDGQTVPSKSKNVLQPFTDLTGSYSLNQTQTDLEWLHTVSSLAESRKAALSEPPQV